MHPDRQRGFALVTAIFLLIVLAALGGFIAMVSTTQHAASSLDVMGAQAFRAANAGIEWGLARVFLQPVRLCTGAPGLTFPVESMTVTVTCTELYTASPGGAVEQGFGHIYQITALACNLPSAGACPGTPLPGNAGAPNYVERGVAVTAETPPP